MPSSSANLKLMRGAALAALAAAAACGPATGARPTSPAPAANGATSENAPRGGGLSERERASHVLDRLAFGARPGDIQRVTSMGVDKWIEAQLEPVRIDDSLLLRRAQQRAGQLTNEIVAATLVRAVGSQRQLQEVMTQFWENHFSVYLPKSPNRFAMAAYDRVAIRPHAMGKFRDLLEAVAKSPQMLFYLDNYTSVVDSVHPNLDELRIETRRAQSSDPDARRLATLPHRRGGRGVNENYARELLELHTLGVDGGYTQKDVQEVARAFTGWTIEAPQLGGDFLFRAEQHDAGEKVVLGHVLPAGRGIEDGEDVLDIIAKHPSTAKFITMKLARHFVSDDPPPAMVERCAATFARTDGDIRATLRCLVRSPEFFSRAAYRAKVKSPFELVASALRAMGAPTDTTMRYALEVRRLGQQIYYHLTPEGWPDRGDAWMNSGAILNRINFGLRLAAGQIGAVRLANWEPAIRLRTSSPSEQVSGVIDELLGGDASAETRRVLTTGVNPILSNAANPAKPAAPQLNGIASIVGLALGSPEFQRR